jgi:hypothetical protein
MKFIFDDERIHQVFTKKLNTGGLRKNAAKDILERKGMG